MFASWNPLPAVAAAAAMLMACAPTSAPRQPLTEPAPRPVASPTTVEHTPQQASPTAAPATPTPRTAAACATPCRGRPRRVGAFPRSQAPEASGLAASRRNPGLLYVLDDGPGTTSVLVISASTGRAAGRVRVQGLDGTDTESLAVGPCRAGGPWCLYIGDIGDNLGQRSSITVTRVREPALSRKAVEVNGTTAVLRYPDGPADAEALLVGEDASLAIVTKAAGRRGRGAARLYSAEGFGDQTLTPRGRVRLPPPAAPLASVVLGNVVTGGDATRGRVVLRTYDALYEFTAPAGDEPLHTFPDWPVRQLRAPDEVQGEAVAYAADGCGLFTVSEDSGRVTSLPCE